MILGHVKRLPKGRYALESRYHPRLVELAHELPGLKFHKPSKTWVAHGDAMRLLLDRSTAEGFLKAVGQVPPIVGALSVPTPKTPAYTAIDKELKRPYQTKGVHFLATQSAEGCILIDDMGLGKTKQTLVAIRDFLKYPAVIVCPSSVKNGWRKEGAKLGLDVFQLDGVQPPTDGHIQESDGIVVVNYDILYAWLEYLKGARVAVFDECQYLIGDKSRRRMACKELSVAAEHVVGLSATPYSNATKQFWSVVDVISPGRFGDFFPFGMRYANGHQVEIDMGDGEIKKVYDFKGSSHLEELQDRTSRFTLRRTKAEVQLQIPTKNRDVIEIDVPLEAFDTTWSLESKTAAHLALANAARAKVPQCVEITLRAIANGSSVVVWAYERLIAKELQAAFLKSGHDVFMATGEQTVVQRLKAAEQAAASQPSILIATLNSMGAGVDVLSYADIAVFCELHYDWAVLLQAEGRLDRFGQIRPTWMYFLIALGTIDERIRDLVLTKLENFESVIGSMGDFGESLRGNSLEDSLAELRELIRKADEADSNNAAV